MLIYDFSSNCKCPSLPLKYLILDLHQGFQRNLYEFHFMPYLLHLQMKVLLYLLQFQYYCSSLYLFLQHVSKSLFFFFSRLHIIDMFRTLNKWSSWVSMCLCHSYASWPAPKCSIVHLFSIGVGVGFRNSYWSISETKSSSHYGS